MRITVTEFVRPNGHQVLVDVFIHENCVHQYHEIIESGCLITMERTSNGDFFICIEDPLAEEDFITDIFHDFNSRNFIDGVSKVISGFNPVDHAKWRNEREMGMSDEPIF